MVQYFPVITGSLTVQGNVLITGSINTTAGITGSFSGTATTAQTASSVANLNQNVQITGSLTTSGTITAQTLNVQTVTSSIVYSSGSNIFGNSLSNTQQMTGSVLVTGSMGIGTIPSFPLEVNSTSTGLLGRFTSNQIEAQLRLVNTSAGGRSYSLGSGGTGSAGARGFYIYDETAATTVFAISGSGNVGIGTTALTSVGAYKVLALNGTDGSIVDLRFNGSDNGRLFSSSTTAVGIESLSTTLPLEFKTQNGSGSTVRMTITPAGNVGIGTTAPSREMVLYRSSGEVHFKIANGTTGQGTTDGFDLAIDSSGGAYLINRENQPMYFFTNGTERMTMYAGGGLVIAASSTNQTLTTGDAGITRTNTYFGTGQVRIGGGSDHGANTVLSVAPGVVTFDRPGVGGGALTINSSGYVLTPSQPAFYAYLPGGATTTTTGNYAGFNTTRLNRGSHYSTSTGRFTAPVAGVYRFIFAALYRRQSGTSSGEISISINGSNVNNRGLAYVVNNIVDGHTPVFTELIISLNANDYVMPFIFSVGAGSDWYMGENLAYFGGYLIG